MCLQVHDAKAFEVRKVQQMRQQREKEVESERVEAQRAADARRKELVDAQPWHTLSLASPEERSSWPATFACAFPSTPISSVTLSLQAGTIPPPHGKCRGPVWLTD